MEDRRPSTGCGVRLWLWIAEFARYDIAEPVCHPLWHHIHRGVGTVDADALECQSEQRGLLAVGEGERLEATEYDWMVCDDDGVVVFDCLVSDSARQVDGEEHRVHLPAQRVEGGFQEEAGVVERLVSEDFGVTMRRGQWMRGRMMPGRHTTHSLRIESTTAFVKGEVWEAIMGWWWIWPNMWRKRI